MGRWGMLAVAAGVWLLTAAVAYGSWMVAELQDAQGGVLVPLGVFLSGLAVVIRVTWRVAHERQEILNRLQRLEEKLSRDEAKASATKGEQT